MEELSLPTTDGRIFLIDDFSKKELERVAEEQLQPEKKNLLDSFIDFFAKLISPKNEINLQEKIKEDLKRNLFENGKFILTDKERRELREFLTTSYSQLLTNIDIVANEKIRERPIEKHNENMTKIRIEEPQEEKEQLLRSQYEREIQSLKEKYETEIEEIKNTGSIRQAMRIRELQGELEREQFEKNSHNKTGEQKKNHYLYLLKKLEKENETKKIDAQVTELLTKSAEEIQITIKRIDEEHDLVQDTVTYCHDNNCCAAKLNFYMVCPDTYEDIKKEETKLDLSHLSEKHKQLRRQLKYAMIRFNNIKNIHKNHLSKEKQQKEGALQHCIEKHLRCDHTEKKARKERFGKNYDIMIKEKEIRRHHYPEEMTALEIAEMIQGPERQNVFSRRNNQSPSPKQSEIKKEESFWEKIETSEPIQFIATKIRSWTPTKQQREEKERERKREREKVKEEAELKEIEQATREIEIKQTILREITRWTVIEKFEKKIQQDFMYLYIRFYQSSHETTFLTKFIICTCPFLGTQPEGLWNKTKTLLWPSNW